MAVDYCESRGISTNARKVEDIKFTDSKGNYNFKAKKIYYGEISDISKINLIASKLQISSLTNV